MLRQRKPMKRTAMRRGGKKTAEWDAVKKELKQEFLDYGITHCELSYRNCTKDDFLTWAHGKKRRHLQPGELKNLIVLACQNCHQIIERLSESEMCDIVTQTIKERDRRLQRRREQCQTIL